MVPVLIGSAEGDNGVRRLLKALRHDVPEVRCRGARNALPGGRRRGGADPQDLHGGHGGKLSLARVLRGQIKDGAVLHGEGGREARIGGIFALVGDKQIKRTCAQAGDTVALARLEPLRPARRCPPPKRAAAMPIERLTPVYRPGGGRPGPQGRGQAQLRQSPN
jgi:elongation factor G